MKNMKSYKFLPFALLTGCLLLQPGCSSDYMDTVPTESAGQSTINSSLENLYIALNGIHRKMSLKIWVTRVWVVSQVSSLAARRWAMT